MKDQRKFKLFGDQGIEGKKTKFFTRSHPQKKKKRGKNKRKKKNFFKKPDHTQENPSPHPQIKKRPIIFKPK